MLPAFPKPSQVRKQRLVVKVYPDGREVCVLTTKKGMDEYMDRKKKMWERQGRRCALQISDQCKVRQGRWPFDATTFDHQNGRGMAGGKRDDRIEVEGKWLNAAVCWGCNGLKSSQNIPYLIDAP